MHRSRLSSVLRVEYLYNSRQLAAMAPKQLNFITGNKNKLAEVQAILAPTGVDLKNQSLDLLEIQGTIEEISHDKCRRAAEQVCILDY